MIKKFQAISKFGIWYLASNLARAQSPQIPTLQPPRGGLSPTFWEQHGWQVMLGGVALLGVIAIGIILLRRPKPVVIEAPLVLARRALANLRGRPEDGALAVEVSRVLKRYLMAVLNVPAGELTTAELREILQAQTRMNPGLATAIADFLRRCDTWKFAPARPAPQLNAVQSALELVEQIESQPPPPAPVPNLATGHA